ncbi:MAG: cytochrome c biogenesis protein CcdA [Candidatus Omnitrophota bacterium]
MSLSGSPLDYLIAFFGGILVSFTPCVYPLIPISAGYIGVRAAGSRAKGLVLSLFYVTGVAVTYCVLGILASLTGTIFGAISTNPKTYLIVGIIIIIFGFSMLDLFTIKLPNIVKPASLKKGNYFSTFLLGLSSGFIVSPCLTPVLGSILFYLATKKNILYAATLLFSFAYGMGLLLILIGTFSSVLINLPKAGKWLIIVKRAFSFVLIAMGAYFIYTGIRRL